MKMQLSRRRFIRQSGSAAALAAIAPTVSQAVEPFERPGKARLLTSIAAYSFREYFHDASHERRSKIADKDKISLFDFVDFCAKQGCAGAELTGYYFPSEVTNEFLLKLKRHAFLRGVAISGTAVGNSFTHAESPKRQEQLDYVKRWIDYARVMGAPHVRVFAGNKGQLEHKAAVRNCIKGLEECGEYAAERGVFLGIENHGGIVAEADPLLEIVKTISNPWIGINLDTGNFHTDDPYGDIERCAPYAVNVQLKVEIQPRGQKRKTKSDLGRLVRILKDARYQGFVVLEHEAAENPWTSIPGYIAEINQLIRH